MTQRTISLATVFTIFSFVFFINSPSHAQPAQSDVEAITQVSNARAAAFNQSDVVTIASYFTEDALLMAPGGEARVGQAAVKAYYQAIFDEYTPELSSHYEEVEVSGDMAYGRGEATVTLTPKSGGATTTATSKYLNILKRQPDRTWKTTHDIWNGNDAPED